MSELDFLVGKVIKEIRYATPGILRIVFEGRDVSDSLYADVGPCTYVDPAGARHEIVPRDHVTVGALLCSVGHQVNGISTDGGTLELSLESGSYLRCDPDDEYDAWEVVGGSPQHLVVCLPGGELAVWDERTPVQRFNASDIDPAD